MEHPVGRIQSCWRTGGPRVAGCLHACEPRGCPLWASTYLGGSRVQHQGGSTHGRHGARSPCAPGLGRGTRAPAFGRRLCPTSRSRMGRSEWLSGGWVISGPGRVSGLNGSVQVGGAGRGRVGEEISSHGHLTVANRSSPAAVVARRRYAAAGPTAIPGSARSCRHCCAFAANAAPVPAEVPAVAGRSVNPGAATWLAVRPARGEGSGGRHGALRGRPCPSRPARCALPVGDPMGGRGRSIPRRVGRKPALGAQGPGAYGGGPSRAGCGRGFVRASPKTELPSWDLRHFQPLSGTRTHRAPGRPSVMPSGASRRHGVRESGLSAPSWGAEDLGSLGVDASGVAAGLGRTGGQERRKRREIERLAY